MQLELFFKNIVDVNGMPEMSIKINEYELYRGLVVPHVALYYEPNAFTPLQLTIEFINKSPSDTITENGKIVKDKSFELSHMLFDEHPIHELIWDSEYICTNNAVYKSCLFFGPAGKFVLNFYAPTLHWILKSLNEKRNDNPEWESDFIHYTKAWNILKQISS